MSYDSVVLSFSPLVYYPMQETSGTTVNDISGNGRNGTYIGSPPLAQAGLVPTIPGDVSVSCSPGKYARAPSTVPTITGATGGTVLFWVQSSGGGTTAKSAYRSGSGGWRLDAESSTTMKIVVSGTYNTGVNSSVLTDGNPHLVAVSAKDVTYVKLLIDAAVLYNNTGAPPVGSAGTSVLWTVGQNDGFTQGLTGLYERFALFSPPLADADVAAIYSARLGLDSVGVLLG